MSRFRRFLRTPEAVAGAIILVALIAMALSASLLFPGDPQAIAGPALLPPFQDWSLPLGTAYAVWTGIGAVGAFVVGVALLGEAVSVSRVIAAMLIVSGLVLMKTSAG